MEALARVEVGQRVDIFNEMKKRLKDDSVEDIYLDGDERTVAFVGNYWDPHSSGRLRMMSVLSGLGLNSFDLAQVDTTIQLLEQLSEGSEEQPRLQAIDLGYKLFKHGFPSLVFLQLLFSEGRWRKVEPIAGEIVLIYRKLEELGAGPYVRRIEEYQQRAIALGGPFSQYLCQPFTNAAPYPSTDNEARILQYAVDGSPFYDYRREAQRSTADEDVCVKIDDYFLTRLPFHELRKPSGGHHWWPTVPELRNIISSAPLPQSLEHPEPEHITIQQNQGPWIMPLSPDQADPYSDTPYPPIAVGTVESTGPFPSTSAQFLPSPNTPTQPLTVASVPATSSDPQTSQRCPPENFMEVLLGPAPRPPRSLPNPRFVTASRTPPPKSENRVEDSKDFPLLDCDRPTKPVKRTLQQMEEDDSVTAPQNIPTPVPQGSPIPGPSKPHPEDMETSHEEGQRAEHYASNISFKIATANGN